MTNREFYNAIINGEMNDEIVTFAQAAVEKLDARNAKRAATPSKAQIANAPLVPLVLASLNAETPTLTTAVATSIGTNTQKANGILGNLYNEGKVTKVSVPVKGKGKQVGWLLIANTDED